MRDAFLDVSLFGGRGYCAGVGIGTGSAFTDTAGDAAFVLCDGVIVAVDLGRAFGRAGQIRHPFVNAVFFFYIRKVVDLPKICSIIFSIHNRRTMNLVSLAQIIGNLAASITRCNFIVSVQA